MGKGKAKLQENGFENGRVGGVGNDSTSYKWDNSALEIPSLSPDNPFLPRNKSPINSEITLELQPKDIRVSLPSWSDMGVKTTPIRTPSPLFGRPNFYDTAMEDSTEQLRRKIQQMEKQMQDMQRRFIALGLGMYLWHMHTHHHSGMPHSDYLGDANAGCAMGCAVLLLLILLGLFALLFPI